MEDIKLILNGESVGSVSVDADGSINKVFVHKNILKENSQKIIEDEILGTKVSSKDYHSLNTL